MRKEWMMRKLLSGVLVSTLSIGAWLYAGEMRKLAGRVVLHSSSTVAPGGGLGLTAAGGTLTLLDGTAHAFAVSGLNLQGQVGSPIDLEAKGEVSQCLTAILNPVRRCGWTVSTKQDLNRST